MLADIMYKLNYQTRLSIWAILNKNIRLGRMPYLFKNQGERNKRYLNLPASAGTSTSKSAAAEATKSTSAAAKSTT